MIMENLLEVLSDTMNGLMAGLTETPALVMGGMIALILLGSFAAMSMSLYRARTPRHAAG